METPPFVPDVSQPQQSANIADAPKVVVVKQEPPPTDAQTPSDTTQHKSPELPKFTEHTPSQPYYMNKK